MYVNYAKDHFTNLCLLRLKEIQQKDHNHSNNSNRYKSNEIIKLHKSKNARLHILKKGKNVLVIYHFCNLLSNEKKGEILYTSSAFK